MGASAKHASPGAAHRRTPWLSVLFCCGFLLAAGDVSAQPAEVDLQPAQEETRWAGEQIIVYLELKTSGQSFSDIFFDLPAVDGAFLLRPDSNTIKSNENRAGESWQVLRYPLALFAPQGGRVTVPAFEVRFKTSGGFGTAPTSHQLMTPARELEVRQPPGTNAGDLVIASPRLTVTQSWSVPPEPLKPGDAVTLKVSRSAAQLSAMLLPPLPLYETQGLAAYPAAPVLQDRSNRGQLVGERTDEITWIIERSGSFSIPAVRFRWWNPATEQLQDQLVEGLSLEVPVPPGGAPDRSSGSTGAADTGSFFRWLLLTFLAATAVTGLLWYGRDRIITALRTARRRILPPARTLLKQLNP